MVVRGVRLREQTAREHDPGDLLLQEEFDVVGLGDAALGLGAQHRCEALLGEGAADDLGERGEDRVLQLGQDQADQAGALAAQLGGPLVAQDVQRAQYGLPGRLGDPRFAVKYPADRGLADPNLLRHLSKSSRHRRKANANTASGLLQCQETWATTGR
ncbi:hypothetical protein SLI_7220 [Streptomyces lividans 1326]|uniref:Uncharacterized protein n=1 Tax=Streptomyces lividans 1326 TaxID=1200984 RepID=A0A7U9HF23_STRLI|nr:hypothetical protein SLI_7220 [Streptomyces lividans 1326]